MRTGWRVGTRNGLLGGSLYLQVLVAFRTFYNRMKIDWLFSGCAP